MDGVLKLSHGLLHWGAMLSPELIDKLEALRGAGQAASGARACLPLGIVALDNHLGGGISCGAVTEIFGQSGQGAWWLALRALAGIKQKTCALVEPAGTFFPPGAAALGVDLGRLLIVRESNRKQALWALDRIAREKHIAATVAAIPNLKDTELRRLQLAAEASGQALVLLRPPSELSRASWGAMRLLVHAQPGSTRRLVVEVLRVRGAAMLRPMLLEFDDDAMDVRISALLPHRADHSGHAHRAG